MWVRAFCFMAVLLSSQASAAGMPTPDSPADACDSLTTAHWSDRTRCLIDQRALSAVRTFDEAFGLLDHPQTASYSLRAISAWRLDADGAVVPALRLRATVALPRLGKRFSLLLSGDQQETVSESGLDIPRVLPPDNALSLRWIAVSAQQLQIETDAGIRSGPDLFLRARLRRGWRVTDSTDARLLQTLRYGVQEHLRSLTNTDVVHRFSPTLVGSLYHVLDVAQTRQACPCWTRGLLLATPLPGEVVLSAGFGQDGHSAPAWQTERDYLWLRWRQPLWRRWMAWELEPRLTREHLMPGDTRLDPSLVLRLEVRFGKMRHPQLSAIEQLSRPPSRVDETNATP